MAPAPATPEDAQATTERGRTAGQGEHWFRGGPGHAGASAALGPVEEPTQLWSVDLGAVVFATPTLVEIDGALTAFVGTHGGRFVGVAVSGEDAGSVGLDLDLGGRIWATAALGEGPTLYVGNDDDTLFAIDPSARGEAAIRWQKRLGNCEQTRSPGPEGARCDVDGGPTIGPDGDLFVGADGVYRLSPAGELRWHWPPLADGQAPEDQRAKHVFSSPVLSADGRLYFGGQDGFVTALDAETGEQRWQYTVRADVDGSGVIGPDAALYIGADDGRIYALRPDGSLRWSFVAQRDIRSSLGVSPDGQLYATSFDGNLYSLAPSGEIEWVLATGGIIHASPVVDGEGRIYVGSQDDHLYALSPAGEVLWAVDVGADIDSSVAIAPGRTLIVGADDGQLRAFGPQN
ncbi:PQQ-like beta-propeller repeat protein [Pseudenhygromyxa sp. WMMC2535]|uniref:outer membrane protein assembly factor BamB family protein n=1 Tax=Pseudenhygromyxa sp. WMMC2535 TaxID=2712867 RepID=UPI001555F20F|nr:PQQ-binding-like beta-propeller repeat protein [Pseudenhygromyxa sp. WMMC2535]NVB40156.1 PQQ-like beta-propeller repeat protein [Pseudenhygromyxa sp. WMMC2535]